MMREVLQVIFSGIGTAGFALFFLIPTRHLFLTSLGGSMGWLVYLIVHHLGGGIFLSTLVAATCVCLWSEALARVRKAPANLYLLPGIVPLLPGGALYYTMSGVVSGDMGLFIQKLGETGAMAIGIAGGVLVGSEVVRVCQSLARRKKKALARKAEAAAQMEARRARQLAGQEGKDESDLAKNSPSGPVQMQDSMYNENREDGMSSSVTNKDF